MPSSPLIYSNNTVTASPADATETIIGTISGVDFRYPGQSVWLFGSCTIVTGANTTEARLRWRRSSVAGTVVGGPVGIAVPTNSGTLGMLATCSGFDGSVADQALATYVLTATMTAATAAATVSALTVIAFVF